MANLYCRIVRTGVPTTFVGTTGITKVAGRAVSASVVGTMVIVSVVPTKLVGTAVPASVVGTMVIASVVPTWLVETAIPASFVGTAVLERVISTRLIMGTAVPTSIVLTPNYWKSCLLQIV